MADKSKIAVLDVSSLALPLNYPAFALDLDIFN
jgi:hypothetical protein